MIAIRDYSYDHSHDLLTWSQHVTYESQPDIQKSTWYQAIIDTHIRITTTSISWKHLDLLITIARVFSKSSTTTACVFRKSRNLLRALSRALWGLPGRLPSDQHSFSRSSGRNLRGVPSIVTKKKPLVETTVSGTGRLAGHSISVTLKDVNVSFNLYHTTWRVEVTAE